MLLVVLLIWCENSDLTGSTGAAAAPASDRLKVDDVRGGGLGFGSGERDLNPTWAIKPTRAAGTGGLVAMTLAKTEAISGTPWKV